MQFTLANNCFCLTRPLSGKCPDANTLIHVLFHTLILTQEGKLRVCTSFVSICLTHPNAFTHFNTNLY